MKTCYFNGKIYSPKADGHIEYSDAMITEDDKIIFVGSLHEATTMNHTWDKQVDLLGQAVLPGLCDGHAHPAWTTMELYAVNLYVVREDTKQDSIRKIQDILKAEHQKNPGSPILRGAGFDSGVFVTQGYPTANDLDQVTTQIPIVLRSFCYHFAWANSKALEMAGISRDTPDPRNGKIYRDVNGNPTGYFAEMDAIDLLIHSLEKGDYSVEEYKVAILDYQKRLANQYGVTMVFDALATPNGMQAYQELAMEGKLSIRVRANHYADPSKGMDQFDKLPNNLGNQSANDAFKINTVKFFLDGSGTAFYMLEPFEEEFLLSNGLEKNYRGYPIWRDDEIREAFPKINAMGYQIHVHAMGDAAVAQALDGMEESTRRNDTRKNRNVIAHMMCIAEEDKSRLAHLAVIACMQPCWAYVETFYDYYYLPLFGEYRSQRMYPLKSFIESGALLSFGTDYPVTVPPNPFKEIQYSMTRSIADDAPEYEKYKGRVMGPDEDPERECVSLEEAVCALTRNGAFQLYIEEFAGSLEKGKSADFIVLDQDIFAIPTEDIGKTKVLMTVFKGKTVFQAV